MSTSLSTLSYALRKISAATPMPIGYGHAQQLVVASLGHKSLAAYQAAGIQGLEHPILDAVRHVALNQPLLAVRADELNVGHSVQTLVSMLTSAWEQCIPDVHVYPSEDTFEDVLRQHIDDVAVNDDDTGSEMASTNSDGIGEVYMPFDLSMFEAPTSGNIWELEIDGYVSMNLDTERPYSGHQIDVLAKLTIERFGLATFGEYRCEVTQAELDYNWG